MTLILRPQILATLAIAFGCSGKTGAPSAVDLGGSSGTTSGHTSPESGGSSSSGTLADVGGSTASTSEPRGMGGIGAGGMGGDRTGATSSGANASGGNATTSTSSGGVSLGGSPSGGRSAAASTTGGARAGGSGGALSTGGMRSGGASAIGGSRSGSSSGGVAVGGSVTVGGAAVGGTGPAVGGSVATSSAPSSGCSATNVTTGASIDGTITVGGQARTYRLSVPTDFKSGEALPVVFVFNGVGGTGAQAQLGFQLELGHRAIFIYPDALPNSTTGGQIAWVFDQTGIDVAYFDALVTFLTQNYCVDKNRLFALGASSGAIMSNMLGCFRGDVLRAIAPSSGMTWQQSGCKGDVAAMVICGTQDTYNACDDAKNGALSETNVWVPQNGCTQPAQSSASSISSICAQFQGCKAADPVLLCTHSGGHGWPTSNGDFWWQFFMSLN